MQKDQQKLIELIKGKKVAFIGAGVSHKTLIKEFVEMGAHVTEGYLLYLVERSRDCATRKRAWRTLAITLQPSRSWAST